MKKQQFMKYYNEDDDDDSKIYYDGKKSIGYTVENHQIVQWDEEKHGNQGYVKYISDPYQRSTTGDPYDDYAKVLRTIDGCILDEGYHPLVAACPEIGVDVEKLIISKAQNVSMQTGQTQTKQIGNSMTISTSNSHNDGNSFSTSASLGYGIEGVKASISINYSHSWSNSITTGNVESTTTTSSNTNSWTSTLGINRAETAWLNANVRYINVGTAPIYDCKPTLNFVLGKDKEAQTISTVTAKDNTVANVILPNNCYPQKHQNPIAFNTNDDFNSHPIMLNFEQVDRLEKGEALQIETLQTFSKYSFPSGDLSLGFDESRTWSNTMNIIHNRTACITIMFDNNYSLRRRVSARKWKNYHQQTQPELTLRQAIEIAFPHVKLNNHHNYLVYKNMYHHEPKVVIDEFTNEQIKIQGDQYYQNNSGQTMHFFDIKLIQGMNILLIAQHSDQGILEIITKFLKTFKGEQAINITINPHEKWLMIVQEIKNLLFNKLGDLSFKRIKDLQIEDANDKIIDSVNERGMATKHVHFTIGDTPSELIPIEFMNILTDKALCQKVKDFLQNFNEKNRFDLITCENPRTLWSQIIANIQEVLLINFGHNNAQRIENLVFIYNSSSPIEEDADDNGNDYKHLSFSVGNEKSDSFKMYFKNIKIPKIPDEIVLNYQVWPVSSSISGGVVGIWDVKCATSEEVRILQLKKYRQKSYQLFIKKYPKVVIEYDSYITNANGQKDKIVQKIIEYDTKQIFQSNHNVRVERISDYYSDRFITGGLQAYTEIHSCYKNDSLYLQTASHAGGGGASFGAKDMKAQIKIVSLVLKS